MALSFILVYLGSRSEMGHREAEDQNHARNIGKAGGKGFCVAATLVFAFPGFLTGNVADTLF